MSEQAVGRSLDSYLTSRNPNLRAQGQYLQTGRVPEGYTELANGGVHPTSDMRHFMDRYGWLLMAGLPLGGLALGTALAPAAAASSSAAAVPSIPVTAGLPSGTVAGGAGAAGAAHGGVMGGMFSGFGARDALQLAPMVASLFGGHGNSAAVPQSGALEQLLRMQTQRMQMTDPLYQAMVRMAMGMLPVSARAGLQMPGMPQGPMPPQLPGRVR